MLTKAISCSAILILLGADWKSHYMLLGYSNKSLGIWFVRTAARKSLRMLLGYCNKSLIFIGIYISCPCTSPEISVDLLGYSDKSLIF